MSLIKQEKNLNESGDPLKHEMGPRGNPHSSQDFIPNPDRVVSPVKSQMTEVGLAINNMVLIALTGLGNQALLTWRMGCVNTMTKFSNLISVRWLMGLLNVNDADLRNNTIRAMGQMQHGETSFIPMLLENPNPDVRIFAVNILDSTRHPLSEKWLIDVIDHDPNVLVCAEALDLLSEIATQTAHAPLFRIKARYWNEPYIQLAADYALKEIQKNQPVEGIGLP